MLVTSFSMIAQLIGHDKVNLPILGLHPRDETAMLVYKTKAKCRARFA